MAIYSLNWNLMIKFIKICIRKYFLVNSCVQSTAYLQSKLSVFKICNKVLYNEMSETIKAFFV